MRAFLEDVCADGNRHAALKAGPSATLVAINASGLFHQGEKLSPAAGIAVCPQGRLFVTDEFNHRVLVYAPDRSLVTTIGAHGTGSGEFRYPRGIAIAPDGTIYIADAWNHRIVVIGPDLAVKGSIGSLGNGAGQLDEPCGVAYVNGTLAVVEKSNHRIQLFTPDGVSIAIFGKRGSADEQARFYAVPVPPEIFSPPVFEFPTALAVDAAGCFYVADTNNHRVVKLSSAGAYLSAYTTPGLRYPVGAACDEEGNLHVTQFNREGVHVFSPRGIYLYKYMPRGIEMPVAVTCAGNAVYVGAGMTARVAALTIDARHDAGCALESPFSFSLKEALEAIAAGEWGSAFDALGTAADTAPLPDELTAALPESDFASFPPPQQPPHAGAAAFCRLLDEAAAERWKMLENLLARKTAAADENCAATLQIEKTLLLGTAGVDDFMVAKWRSIKTLLNLSADFKRTMAGLRKIAECRRRLTRAGQEIPARLAVLAAERSAVAALGKARETWFTDAAKEAPALNFNSAPAERAAFAINENRLSQTAFEYRALWSITADAHFEIAALATAGLLDKDVAAEHIGPALGLLLDAPEEAATRLNFLNSVEALLEAAGPKAVATWVGANESGAAWEALGREDNIHPVAQRPVYALLAALWTNGGAEGGHNADASAWEKMTAFYHVEFKKFVGENAPLHAELLRNIFLLPLAEKSDPKQASLMLRKISLLNYHLIFQERYIGGLMLEYLTRHALFAAKTPGLPPDVANRTAAALDALIGEAAIAGNSEIAATDAAMQKLKTAGTADEKQDLKIRHAAAYAASNYFALLGAHLALTRAALPKSTGHAPHAAGSVFETASGFRPLTGPSAALFDAAGNLYVVARSTVSVYDKDLRPFRTLGAYGRGPGKFETPMDIAFAPDGGLLVTQICSPVIVRFAPNGSFDRDITLEKIDGRRVYRIQTNGDGNIFASFFDGEGINIHTPDGKLSRSIPLKGSPFERLGGIRGFALVNSMLYAGGNGMLAAVDAKSGALRHFKETGISFGDINGIWPDGAGNLYCIDYARNMVAVTDSDLSAVRLLPGLKTVAVGALATGKNGLLAVCDFGGNRLRLFNATR